MDAPRSEVSTDLSRPPVAAAAASPMSLVRSAARRLRKPFRAAFPATYWALEYWRAARKTSPQRDEHARMFASFLAQCEGKPCVQISVKDEIGRKFGPNWVSVDKYDNRPMIDRHDDIEALGFADASFGGAVCWSVLEHVPHPQTAIRELHRVLKPGGLIWIQVPFLFPYHEAPSDYWRVSPDGLRIWMAEFEEIRCTYDYWAPTSLVAGTYFYGRKPA
jgi:SAM-dependent methyltransferase